MSSLDITQAWKSASRMVGANREVLVAIAGVFLLLPNLALSFFIPASRMTPAMTAQEQAQLLIEEYGRTLPLMLPASIMQMAGLLIVIIVMSDRSRPTVGAAIRRGAQKTPAYFAAQVLVGAGLAVAFAALAALAGAIGNPAAPSGAILVMIVLAVTIGLRMALVPAVIAAEDQRNPILAMRRSWQLTHGSAWRLGSFLLLAALVFVVTSALVMLFVGVTLELAANREVRRIVQALISGVLTTTAMVYVGAILAAVHRQLAGPATFEQASSFD